MTSQLDARARWAALIVLCLGDLMIVLDSTIVNVALNDIRAAFATPIDQIGWVATGYMMANIVVIPMTGWFQRRFGFRETAEVIEVAVVPVRIVRVAVPRHFGRGGHEREPAAGLVAHRAEDLVPAVAVKLVGVFHAVACREAGRRAMRDAPPCGRSREV